MSPTLRNTTLFRHDVRVLACAQCGAPLQAAQPGTQVQCRYCGAALQVTARDDRAVLNPGPREEIDENERYRRLRAQDGTPMLPPASIQHLIGPGGRIEPWRVQEAVQVWNASRAESQSTGSPDAAERLYYLTLVLYQQEGDDADAAHRKRAMLESALDALHIPRHRQVILCTLARSAIFDGDQAAAEAWLSSCDPRSDDLESDSHYRFTKAMLHTVRGQWPGVIATLGKDAQRVPIYDALDSACALLRANAHERMGDVPRAIALLREMMHKGGPAARQVLSQMMERYADFQLCPASYPAAMQAHQASAAASAGASVGGGIAKIFIPLGGIFLLISVGVVVGVIVGPIPAIVLPGILGGLGITGLVFLLIGKAMQKASRRAVFLRLHGLPGRGTIQGVVPTGTKINNVPMMRVSLQVQLADGRPPYTTETKLLQTALGGGAAPGAVVGIRADPTDPQKVLIETD